MNKQESMTLGVVVEKRDCDHPWLDHTWHALDVVPGATDKGWRKMASGDGWTRYYAGTAPLELFRKETEGYKRNLSEPSASVYVILKEAGEDDDGEVILEPFLVTACPYEAEAYEESGDDIVAAVTMPLEVCAWVQAFIDEHHVDEVFVKRKRKGKRSVGEDG